MSGAIDNGAHKDGGRAFPCDQIIERNANGHLHGKEVASGGMTLRDYFAAKAMQGILAGDHPITHELDASNVVTRVAYGFADAMLKARQS